MTSDFMTLAADRIRIVLVGTQHPGNIGSAARAMKTMGLRRLLLVAPEKRPNAESDALAAGADDVLAAATFHDDLASALAGCRRVLGCTARSRRVALPELAPRQAAEEIAGTVPAGEVALVFGRERTGLTNEELHLCHQAVHIPANPDYSSLNLASAVQVLAYEVRIALLGHADVAAEVEPREPPASHEQMEGFYAQLGETLDAIDFHKGRTPDSAMRKLRRIFNRAEPDERELRLLRGVLADAQRMAMLAGQRGDPG
jgi:tRNA (cytidine32/uridine32-2'-O)-methyltransferase